MITKFSYNIEKDLENYDYSYFDFKFSDYGRDLKKLKINVVRNLPRSIIEQISDESKAQQERVLIIRNFLEKFQKDKNSFIETSIRSIEALWHEKEADYLKRLSDCFGKEVFFDSIGVNFTTLGICPYNTRENSFYLSFWQNLADQVGGICHETMHLMFRHHFQDYCSAKGLTPEEVLIINEAMVVLLNFKFFDLIIVPEQNNKPTTLPLQSHIADLCRQKKDFNYILESSIEFIKKNR